MDKVAYYKEEIYKVAITAEKARRMAKEVGIFPIGQWKWALRQLRDKKGNLLKGKALSEAKKKLGSMDNNSYQQLKALERKMGSGKGKTENWTPTSGIELGGEMNRAGKATRIEVGGKGVAPVTDYTIDKKVFHTHPVAGKNLFLSKGKKIQKESLKDKEVASDYFKNHSKFDVTDDGQVLLSPDQVASRKDAVLSDMALVAARSNIENKKNILLKKRNPKLVDIGGITTLKEKNLTKQKINEIKTKLDKDTRKHDKIMDELTDSIRTNNEEKFRDLLRRRGELLEGYKSYHKKEMFKRPQDYFYGDAALAVDRAKSMKAPVQSSILAPTQDLEGIHKASPSGKIRSVFLDRTPKKART